MLYLALSDQPNFFMQKFLLNIHSLDSLSLYYSTRDNNGRGLSPKSSCLIVILYIMLDSTPDH